MPPTEPDRELEEVVAVAEGLAKRDQQRTPEERLRNFEAALNKVNNRCQELMEAHQQKTQEERFRDRYPLGFMAASTLFMETLLFEAPDEWAALTERASKAETALEQAQTDLASLRETLKWIVALDEPGSVERRTITLNRIIERCRAVVSATTLEQEADEAFRMCQESEALAETEIMRTGHTR